MWNDAYRAQPSAPGFRIAGIRLEQKRGMDPDEIRATVDLTQRLARGLRARRYHLAQPQGRDPEPEEGGTGSTSS